MDTFETELLKRSPLAACVPEVSDYLFDPQLLDWIWRQHRGRARRTF